ncbi:4-hydroxy-tetrahydrodipicolinate reductase [Alphaproteobacteria bacterium]|nr:4-hydroxy-tetrahydrodipicolinate reductase [Alphaproteobacteria bacterium]
MKIGITGCAGRVGQILIEEIHKGTDAGIELAGGTVLTEDLDKYANVGYFVTDDPDELFQKSDAVIDFTTPDATRKHIALAAKHKVTFVIATTGLTAADEQNIKEASKDTPVVYSANYSVAVNMLEALVEKTAKTLGNDFDIEIVEAHHKHKIDAPSGTALMLGKAAAKAKDIDFEKHAVLSREGETGARKDNEIGFSTIRGSDVVGEHTVYFLGEGERLELKQQATNRALYAKGAIRAAIWATKQNPGLYSMRDVLDL